MNYLDEDRIDAEIAAWRRGEIAPARPRHPQRRDYIPGETWTEKYDRLYREYGPRDRFGKSFSNLYRGEKAA